MDSPSDSKSRCLLLSFRELLLAFREQRVQSLIGTFVGWGCSHPSDFKCTIKPRSAQAEALLKE